MKCEPKCDRRCIKSFRRVNLMRDVVVLGSAGKGPNRAQVKFLGVTSLVMGSEDRTGHRRAFGIE